MSDLSSVLWEDRILSLKFNPIHPAMKIQNENRAAQGVADDRARCDMPKNLCIVLAALRINTGRGYQ